MASAWLGSPMTACQSVTGSWLVMSVEARSLRSSDHLDEVVELGGTEPRGDAAGRSPPGPVEPSGGTLAR